MAQATTGMTPGVINYLGGRPSVSPSIHLFSFLYPKNEVKIKIEINEKIFPVEVKANNSYQSSKEKKNIRPLFRRQRT